MLIGTVLAVVLSARVGLAETKTQSHDEQKYVETLFEAARKYFPGDDTAAAPRRIFRLTRDQIDVTVKFLLPSYVTSSVKAVMPKDPLQTNYEYAELLTLNAANASAYTGWVGEIAARVRKSPAALIPCAANAAKDCPDTAARRFVQKAFRGDIEDAALTRYVTFFSNGVAAAGLGAAAGDLVEVVLNAPDFLFRRELDIDRSRRLSPPQLLQALTYIIADAPPDAIGLDSANAGAIVGRGTDRDALLKTIATSAPAREKMLRFFKAWLELKDAGDFTISPVVYPDFNPKLAEAMIEETTRFLRSKLGRDAPSLKDITQSTESYVSASLEGLYGAKAADASGAKPSKLDTAQRLGIFSQPAVIASHSGPDGTRPIKRGVFWVRKVMCMELEPPANGLNSDLPPKQATTTERRRIEGVTSQTACAGCHKLIDPLGFFQESYDALGRFRTTENGQPIDPSVLINFLDERRAKPQTAVEAIKTLTDSMMFKQCFVRQMFRYYMGRQEEAGDDGVLRGLFLRFAETDNILDLVQSFAASDRIARRQ
jgi:hypothetical protein